MKTCSKCKAKKKLDNFTKDKNRKDGLSPTCRQCRNDYYQANKKHLTSLNTARHLRVAEENKMKYCDYLSACPCADCDATDILVLEPDHVGGEKRYNISELVLRAYSWATVEAELAKCEIVCRNCHSIREAKRQNGNYKLRYLARELAT